MREDTPADVRRLLAALQERYGRSLRSCVEYLPTDRTLHYLRDDIEEHRAETRLVYVDELYQAQRLTADAVAPDPDLDRLRFSVHSFGDVVVVHLLDEGGAAVGVSLDRDALADLDALLADWRLLVSGDEPE